MTQFAINPDTFTQYIPAAVKPMMNTVAQTRVDQAALSVFRSYFSSFLDASSGLAGRCLPAVFWVGAALVAVEAVRRVVAYIQSIDFTSKKSTSSANSGPASSTSKDLEKEDDQFMQYDYWTPTHQVSQVKKGSLLEITQKKFFVLRVGVKEPDMEGSMIREYISTSCEGEYYYILQTSDYDSGTEITFNFRFAEKPEYEKEKHTVSVTDSCSFQQIGSAADCTPSNADELTDGTVPDAAFKKGKEGLDETLRERDSKTDELDPIEAEVVPIENNGPHSYMVWNCDEPILKMKRGEGLALIESYPFDVSYRVNETDEQNLTAKQSNTRYWRANLPTHKLQPGDTINFTILGHSDIETTQKFSTKIKEETDG